MGRRYSPNGFGFRKKSWKFGVLDVSILGGYSPTSDLDLGKKVGNLDFGGGVFSNFGFGLRKKSWKVGNLELEIWGGVFSNFGFGLRKKSWKFGFWGGGILEKSQSANICLKLEFWIFGGGVF